MFNTIDELREWIENYINNKGKKSLHIAINNSIEIKQIITSYTNFLPKDTPFNQRCYHIINRLLEIPKCKQCGINNVKFNNRNRDWKYLDHCSPKCGRINLESINKYKKTSIIKWGVDNYSKTKEFKDRMIEINSTKYGVDWYQQSFDFKEKSILSCLKKYGFDRFCKTEEFKVKAQKTFMERYGVDWYTKSDEFKSKFRNTCLEKYGYEHFLLNDELSSKFKKQFKDYKMPSGKIYKIQGYEHIALDELLKHHREDDLLISNADIRKEVGLINYFIEETEKIYLPDIYIKSENKIIEVKSHWTYVLEIEKNKLKKKACVDSGIKFEFWIINKKGKIDVQ